MYKHNLKDINLNHPDPVRQIKTTKQIEKLIKTRPKQTSHN